MRCASRTVALLAATAATAGCGAAGGVTTTTAPQPPRPLTLLADGKPVATLRPPFHRPALPQRLRVQRGRASMVLLVERSHARRLIRQAEAGRRRRLELPLDAVSSAIAIPPVRQVLHNDCEATALSMLLADAGVHVGQLTLQDRLPISGSLDPQPVAGSTLFRWGDPEQGFVGRAAGGGTEGGFGVYEPPIRRLAARYGVRLVDLHGKSFGAVRATLLDGRPVLAWVGLADGPFLSWLTPSGRKITVNLDEHAVTLVGVGPGYVLVDNPLTGVRERWTDALFSARWKLLGHRALALPPG